MSDKEITLKIRRRARRKQLAVRRDQLRTALKASGNMDADVKKVWVKALRSGEYNKGKGTMCRVDNKGGYSFCCLGVLADESIDTDWHRLDSTNHRLGRDGASSSLTGDQREKVGLSADAQDELAVANDLGLRFSTIADAIEECL